MSARDPLPPPSWPLALSEQPPRPIDSANGDTDAQLAARDHALMMALFDQSPVGLQLIDIGRQTIVASNPALQRITGYTEDELKHGDPAKRYTPAAMMVRETWFRDALQTGRFGPSEVEYIHKQGHLINMVFSGVRVVDPSRNTFLWLAVQDVSQYRAMERELRAAANEDRLTGLANRATLLRTLQTHEATVRAGLAPPFTVMFLDFDRFKLVNDTLGHDAGDELLRAIAQRLRDVVQARSSASAGAPWLAARFGGDEFVLLVPDTPDEAAAREHAAALLAVLSAPYCIKQQEIHSSASIGIARWQPPADDAEPASAEALLRDADIAMYEAKRRGRGTCVVYDATMRARLTRALLVERELRQARALGQITMAYQPIVDLDSGRTVAVEALMRWQHPQLGEVEPTEFIPVAEESGQMIELGEWSLRESCRQWAQWRAQDPVLAPAAISVNLSRVQLGLGPRLLATVREALAESGMPPEVLYLELSERDVMQRGGPPAELMQALVDIGIRLSMDDFGTGSSSLACLRDFPFHTIKIDRSFVTGLFRDPHVLAVAHATVNVIENLGMVSVAEGIEDPGELATLQSLGCRCGQGFLFAEAMAPDALLPAIAARGG